MQGFLTSLKCPDPRLFLRLVEVICDRKETFFLLSHQLLILFRFCIKVWVSSNNFMFLQARIRRVMDRQSQP